MLIQWNLIDSLMAILWYFMGHGWDFDGILW